jgi:phage tail sheath protein FI
MTEYLAPGVYVEELSFRAKPIEGVSTSTAGFIGAADGPQLLTGITSLTEFLQRAPSGSSEYLMGAVRGFFENGGKRCSIAVIAPPAPITDALDAFAGEPVSIVCCPDENVFADAAALIAEHCERRKDRFAILQSPQPTIPATTHEPPVHSSYAAYYHPWLVIPNGAATLTIPPGGHIAGVYARTDIERGVWKSPAGARILGATALSQNDSSTEINLLVERGIDAIRSEPGRGFVVWAGRTTSSDSEFTHVNVRRLLALIERSIQQGTQWVVFEPDSSAVWEVVRRSIDLFLQHLWKSGALVGQAADDAYFVRCDRTTMTEDDIDNGRLVAVVGVAPLRPAEFVVLRFICQRDEPLA